MTEQQLLLVLAGVAAAALIVVAVAALALTLAVTRLLRDLRALAMAATESMRLINDLLPPTLGDLRATTSKLSRLSTELEPRVERVDVLLDEGERTLVSLRSTIEAAEELVRGPAAAVDRARRSMRVAGEGIARGADRLRRNVEEAAARRERR